MQTALWISFVLLIAEVWAGAYQGAVERLWIFYAYQIDQLNPPAQRTLGFGCIKPNGRSGWDYSTNTCVGDWKDCGSVINSRTGNRKCNFNELMRFLGRTQKVNFVPGSNPSTDTPDIEGTAREYYQYFMNKNGKVGDPGKAVPNNPPYTFLKNSNTNYQNYVNEIGDVVVRTAQTQKSIRPELFSGFATATDKVIEARTGDHGPFLLQEARSKLPSQISAVQVNVGSGYSPVNDNKGNPIRWETLDWEATRAGSSLSGPDTDAALSRFERDFYSGGEPADHKAVIRNFKDVSARVAACP